MLRHAVAAWGAAVWACTTVAATDGNGRLGVPRVASPPVVDGRMAEGEWHGAVPVGGFQALPKLTRPRTGQRGWLCWDDEALFAAFETWGEAPEGLAARATARDGGVWQDDAFELHLAAGSAGGTAVQFVGNSVGAVYDARGGDASWNGTWEYAASRTQTGWQGELSITWASLGLGTPGVGDVWRVLLCHDDANPDGAEVSACVPVRTNFHDVAAYMTATFGAGVVAAGVTEVSVEDGQASVVVRCVNGSAEPVSRLEAQRCPWGQPLQWQVPVQWAVGASRLHRSPPAPRQSDPRMRPASTNGTWSPPLACTSAPGVHPPGFVAVART